MIIIIVMAVLVVLCWDMVTIGISTNLIDDDVYSASMKSYQY